LKKFDNLDKSVQQALNAADCKDNIEQIEGPEKGLDQVPITNNQVSRFNSPISTGIEILNYCSFKEVAKSPAAA
jgi:hypothetical protein